MSSRSRNESAFPFLAGGGAAHLLADALAVVGHETRTAFDGPHAVALAAEFLPEVALIDIGLPVMDGYEVAAQITAAAMGRPRPIVVAVTGYGRAADVARSHAAGFDAHIVKPVDVSQLLRILEQLLSTAAAK